MCGCECCISAKSMHSSLLTRCDHYPKKLKYQSNNSHNRRSVEIKSRIFETYKNDVIPHGHNIQKLVTYMTMATMCPFSSAQHAQPHWKCVLICDKNV